MFDFYRQVGDGNFAIFDELFAVLPNDDVDKLPDKAERYEGIDTFAGSCIIFALKLFVNAK